MTEEMEMETLKEMIKTTFERIVEVEFNDFVFDSVLTMLDKYDQDTIIKGFYVLKQKKHTIKDYKGLMAFLGGVCRNKYFEKKELVNI